MSSELTTMFEEFLLQSGMMDAETLSNLVAGGLLGTILLIFLGVLIAGAVFGIIGYVINALGIFRLAKKLNVDLAWLAWIPVAQNFTIGKVAEKCDDRRGIVAKSWGKILLIANLIAMVASAVLSGIANLINLIIPGLGVPFGLLTTVISIAVFVLYCICLWKIFREFFKQPVNVILFIVGIVFNVQSLITLIASFCKLCPAKDDAIKNVEYSVVE